MANQVTYILTAALFALILNVQARSYFQRNDYDENEQNSLSPVADPKTKNYKEITKDFVKVTASTEGVIRVKQGDRIELECIAVGSYVPSLDWYKGDVPVTHGEDYNRISPFGVSRVVVRYIEDCAQPKHEGTYSCNALSGGATSSSPPVTVIVSEKMSPRMLNNGGVCRHDQKLPRITRYNPLVMHNMGTDVKMFCRTRGYPRPYVYWTERNGRVLDTSPGSRFKILDNGDLIIRKLRWADMGVYMCVAENSLGKDTTSTFLYPMLAENAEGED